ncbi:hypothetical protein ACWPKS_07635 [Coraliomargarita sp. W4R72]
MNKITLTALLLPFALHAQFTVSDDFSGPTAGTLLNGSTPDVTTGGVTWYSNYLQFNGAGSLETNDTSGVSYGGGAASVALPSLNGNETISMSANVRPLNSRNNYIGIGLFNDELASSGSGELWFLLRGGFNPTTPTTTGNVTSFGDGSSLDEVSGVTSGGLSSYLMSFDYNVGTGAYSMSVGSTVVSSGVIDFSGSLSDLSHAGFVFNSQNNNGTSNPGQIQDFNLSIIPEANTSAILLGVVGLGFAMSVRRRK